MTNPKLKDLEGLDLSKIEKPKLEKKPTKPTKPSATLAKSKIERTTFWKSTKAGEDFNLIEILKKAPKTVDVGDVMMWIDNTSANYSYTKTTHFGTVKEIPNPKYVEANEKYERELKEYGSKLKEWEKVKTTHDERVELFDKYRTLIDASKQKTGLKDKLAKVTEKLRAIGV